jgi:hypothetical protein
MAVGEEEGGTAREWGSEVGEVVKSESSPLRSKRQEDKAGVGPQGPRIGKNALSEVRCGE